MVISINNAVNRCMQQDAQQVLLGIDIFGQTFTINVNGKRNYTTACGGITSVLVIAIVIMSSWNTIINFFWKSNLQVSISSEHNMDSPIIKQDSNNFMLAIGLKQMDNAQLQYFEIEIEQRLYNNNSEQISYIELEKCSNERLLQYNISHLPTLQLQENQAINMTQVLPQQFQGSLLCLKNNQTLHFHQSGPNQLEFLRINIKKCQNFTNSELRCASQDEINQFIRKNRQFTLQLYNQY